MSKVDRCLLTARCSCVLKEVVWGIKEINREVLTSLAKSKSTVLPKRPDAANSTLWPGLRFARLRRLFEKDFMLVSPVSPMIKNLPDSMISPMKAPVPKKVSSADEVCKINWEVSRMGLARKAPCSKNSPPSLGEKLVPWPRRIAQPLPINSKPCPRSVETLPPLGRNLPLVRGDGSRPARRAETCPSTPETKYMVDPERSAVKRKEVSRAKLDRRRGFDGYRVLMES